jgi:hypothetical protein
MKAFIIDHTKNSFFCVHKKIIFPVKLLIFCKMSSRTTLDGIIPAHTTSLFLKAGKVIKAGFFLFFKEIITCNFLYLYICTGADILCLFLICARHLHMGHLLILLYYKWHRSLNRVYCGIFQSYYITLAIKK